MNGILFKPDMIKAITEGRKTQTRRLFNPQPFMERGILRWQPKRGIDINLTDHSDLAKLFSPRKVGEVVYIKEAWWTPPHNRLDPAWHKQELVSYRLIIVDNAGEEAAQNQFWRSPLFMPAWAARYFIQIIDVRAERLQEITEEDAVAEGITILQGIHQAFVKNLDTGKLELVGQPEPYTARYHYQTLWDFINPKSKWDTSPWVWRYEFKRINKEKANVKS